MMDVCIMSLSGMFIAMVYFNHPFHTSQVTMVGLEILLKISPEKRYEFLQTFALMAQRKSVAPGMRHRTSRALFEKMDEPNCFLWKEEWDTADRLASYRQSDHFKSLLGAVDVLGQLIRIRTHDIKE
jgi:quinol monooxygenase YgiN